MERHIVPADNSCLFTSVGFLVEGLMDRAPFYRNVVAQRIRASPERFTEVVLGRAPEAYCQYILSPKTWGGAVELTVLSEALAVGIVAVDVQTGKPYTFGADKGYTRRMFLIYDGVHYDALKWVREDGDLETQTLVSDDAPLASALSIAQELKGKKQFVDLGAGEMRCGACAEVFKGQKEAVAHAKATGHTNFETA